MKIVRKVGIDMDAADAATGIRVLATWRSVYVFVLGTLILWVGLLTLLSRLFS